MSPGVCRKRIMVNHYSAVKERRRNGCIYPWKVDRETTDYATVVYSNLIRQVHKKATPNTWADRGKLPRGVILHELLV